MEQGFRASMNWLHTWSGVVLGGLLFAIFWMGTLSVWQKLRETTRPLELVECWQANNRAEAPDFAGYA